MCFINLRGNSLNGGTDLLIGSNSLLIGTYLTVDGKYATNASLFFFISGSDDVASNNIINHNIIIKIKMEISMQKSMNTKKKKF